MQGTCWACKPTMQLIMVLACLVAQVTGVQQSVILNSGCFWLVQLADVEQTRFETATKTCLLPGSPSFGCNAQRGFTLPLGRTIRSGANNLQASAQACCTACKATHECTVWSWCFDAQGRHSGTLTAIAIHPGNGLLSLV